MWWTPQHVPATLSACSTRRGHRGCPSRLPGLAAVCSSLLHIGLQLAAAPPVRVRAELEVSNARFCGDDYEDSRQCSEPCPNRICPGARSCFEVDTCLSKDPDLDDASEAPDVASDSEGSEVATNFNFCGDDYEDSRQCSEPCPGRVCPGARSCFAVDTCLSKDPDLDDASEAPDVASDSEGPDVATNFNFCGDDYEDSRQCSEPCPGRVCPGARSCFAVDTCVSKEPDLDDAFCGINLLDAQACTRPCRNGLDTACTNGTRCFSQIKFCQIPATGPVAAAPPSPDTGTGTDPSDAEPLAAARPAAGPAGSAMTASAGLMTRGATEPAADVEDPTGGRDTGKLVGIAVAIAVALVIVCVSVVLYLRRTRHARQGRRLELPQVADPGPTHSSRPKPHAASTDDPWTATKSVYATVDSAGLPGPGHSSFLPQPPRTLGPATPARSNSAGAQSTSTRSTAANMTNPTRNTADAPRQAAPGPDAARREQIAFIHHQLDLFTEDTPFLEDYLLLGDGPLKRFQGGQAVVQIARERLSSREVAVKCFVSRSAFDAEAALYLGETPLRQFMPRLRMLRDNADGALVDPHGAALPPCIVMEKGESLDIFCERSRPDQAQAYSVALHIARRVADLHAAGFAHRDLKPSNTMWLTRENRWTLIDFGCAARIDSEAPLSYSLGYAAPEIVQADRTGARSMQVTAALDSWALGVLVMELFAGRSVFSMAPGRTTVMAQIAGDVGQQLPWEDRTQRAELLRRLGTLKRPVLALLDRDPAQRLSVQDFVTSCDLVLAGTTQRSGD
eukprot:jgi/Ulvmu1/627/UM001_0635.1